MLNTRLANRTVLNTSTILLNTVVKRKRPNFFGVWLSDAAKDIIDKRAECAEVDRSEMLRRMLAYAARNMPKEWKP